MTMTDDRPDAPAPSAASSRPNGIAARLAAVVEPLFGGQLPVRLKAWDGTVAGPADAPTVVLRDPAALRRLVRHPGELDVEGDLLDGFRRVWSTARTLAGGRPSAGTVASVATNGIRTAFDLGVVGLPPEPPASQARLRGRLHTQTRDRSAIEHHYNLSNEFYSLILDPHMAYSCGYWTS